MAATYPLAVRSFTTKRNLLDDVEASHVNDIQDEIRAIQIALGVNPFTDNTTKKTYPNVGARLDDIKKGVDRPYFKLYTSGNAVQIPSQRGDDAQNNLKTIPIKKVDDTHGLYDGTGVTIKTAGYYMVMMFCRFARADLTGVRSMGLRHTNNKGTIVANPSVSFFYQKGWGYDFSDLPLNISMVCKANVGDKIFMGASVDVGGNSMTPKWTVQGPQITGALLREF